MGWAFEVALGARAPTEGASPLVSPRAGEPLPRDPPRSNPTLLRVAISVSIASRRVGRPRGLLAEGVGFEPTVRLPGLRFSRPALSAAQPPLHTKLRVSRRLFMVLSN